MAGNETTPDGVTQRKATEDDDVEGHSMRTRESVLQRKETEDDDVEGHSRSRAREGAAPEEGEGFSKQARVADEDDVEGHALRSPSSHGE